MVCLMESDVQTKEVLNWQGLHLFHNQMSSCSQKVRAVLGLKGLHWTSHPIDLLANEHLTPRYMGINPRGLVPTLIDDGHVHIESNDILFHLEERFPEPALIPPDLKQQISRILDYENDIHLDLRTITFRFMFDPSMPPKSETDLQRYATSGSGMVRGERDTRVDREIQYWQDYLRNGVNDETARRAARKLFDAFSDLEKRLAASNYLMGDRLSIADIAWLIYVQRVTYAGYPIPALHPLLSIWQERMMMRPEIAKEVALPEPVREQVSARQAVLRNSRQTLADVCFPDLPLS